MELVAAGAPGIYAAVGEAEEFRQGEIISSVTQYRFDPSTSDVEAISRKFVILASQDCDLLQDHNSLQAGEQSQLNSILLLEAHATSDLRPNIGGSDIWRRIVQNQDDRYQALQAAPPDIDSMRAGLPDLIVDFRRLFAIPTLDLRFQVANTGAKRRCRLETPYREQFQARAGFYLMRVGVPEPHKIAPISKQ